MNIKVLGSIQEIEAERVKVNDEWIYFSFGRNDLKDFKRGDYVIITTYRNDKVRGLDINLWKHGR